jgi:hypothetical protein
MRQDLFQTTISRLMAAILVVALGVAPVAITLRSPRKELIIATAAFEVILLPVIIALLVMVFIKSGPARDRVIVLLCLGWLIVPIAAATTAALSYVLGSAILGHDVTPLAIATFWAAYSALLSWLMRRRRCPACGRSKALQCYGFLQHWPPFTGFQCTACKRRVWLRRDGFQWFLATDEASLPAPETTAAPPGG